MNNLTKTIAFIVAMLLMACGTSNPVGSNEETSPVESANVPTDFDATTYLVINTDLMGVYCDAVSCDLDGATEHYATSGAVEGRNYLVSTEVCGDGLDNDAAGDGDAVCTNPNSSSSVINVPNSSSSVATVKGLECLARADKDCSNAVFPDGKELNGRNLDGFNFDGLQAVGSIWNTCSFDENTTFRNADLADANFIGSPDVYKVGTFDGADITGTKFHVD